MLAQNSGFHRVFLGKPYDNCDFHTICKYYRVFPADIAEKPYENPVNPHKHF